MYTMTDGATITELDIAPAGRYLLFTPKGRFILSPAAARLIRSLEGRESVAELGRSAAEVDQLERILREQVLPTGVFAAAHEVDAPRTLGRPRSSYVHATRTLLGAPSVGRLAELVRPLFRAWLAVPALIAAAVAQAAFLRASHGLRLEDIPAEAYFAGALLFLVTLPLHEIGHAAACSHFACRPGAMGFGFYLVFPCFYTDVSDAWRLSRWKRVVVDLGGMHVQFLCAGLFSLMFLGTGSAAWAAAVLMVDGSIVLNLKPYLRRDGYWILMDVVGIAAPYQAAREYARYLVRPRRRAAARPALLMVSPGLRWFTLAYVALVGAASIFLVATLLWKTATVILPAYPSALAALARDPFASAGWFSGFLRALVQTSVIGGVCVFLWSRARAGVSLVPAWIGRHRGAAPVESKRDSVVAGGRCPNNE
jgi:hypothetical protein